MVHFGAFLKISFTHIYVVEMQEIQWNALKCKDSKNDWWIDGAAFNGMGTVFEIFEMVMWSACKMLRNVINAEES